MALTLPTLIEVTTAILAWGAAGAPAPMAARPSPPAAPATASPVAPRARPYVGVRDQQPGKRVMIVPADMPPPRATKSVNNPPRLVTRPKGALPQAPAGFTVQLYADGLSEPRLLRVAPNGDAFVVESEAGAIKVVRGLLATGKAAWSGVFAKGLKQPFGIAFYPAGDDPRW